MIRKVCEVEACKGCPMREMFPHNTFVPPFEGNLRLAVGESPNAKENEEGGPFPDGWRQGVYRKAGIPEAGLSKLNIIQCQPPNGIFPTDPDAKSYTSAADGIGIIKHCREAHLLPFLKSKPWERIDVLGDKPLRYLLGRGGGIHTWRGSILPVPDLDNRRIAIATFSPMYLAKDQSMYPVVVNDLRKPLDIEPENYNIYPSLSDVQGFTSTKFAFDIETTGWQTGNQKITLVGLSDKDYGAIVVPFEGEYIDELKRIFINATEVIGQNIVQFDLPVLQGSGIGIRGPKECMVWDIMLMHHLRFPVFPHKLEFIGKQFTNKGAWKADKVSFETYCARDVDVTYRCFNPLHTLLSQANLLDVYKYVSWPLAKICKMMTEKGVRRSSKRILTLREELKQKIVETEQLLPEHLRTQIAERNKRYPAPEGYVNEKGKEVKYILKPEPTIVIPWRSVEVKKKFLYEELRDAKGRKLPERRHMKTKKLTADKNALDWLYSRYKLPELKALKELNKYATLLSGFAKDEMVKDDTLHPSFNPHGTETGRLSSSDPNFQNQPAAVRFSYVPRTAGGKIISVDYSGIENRLVAHAAGDRKRSQWFKDGSFSEHKYLAGLLSNVPYEEVEKSKEKDSPYAISKIIVHGTDRMMGSLKIANQFDLPFNTVKDFQAKWKVEIADTIAWQRRTGDTASRIGYVRNAFKRMLWLWETNSATRAVSFMPQSSAADIIFRAMISLMYSRIDWPEEWALKVVPIVMPLPEGCFLIAQVHDELVVETTTAEQVQPCLDVLRTVMTQPWPELGGLKLPIGEAYGDSWGDCE